MCTIEVWVDLLHAYTDCICVTKHLLHESIPNTIIWLCFSSPHLDSSFVCNLLTAWSHNDARKNSVSLTQISFIARWSNGRADANCGAMNVFYLAQVQSACAVQRVRLRNCFFCSAHQLQPSELKLPQNIPKQSLEGRKIAADCRHQRVDVDIVCLLIPRS